MLRSLARIARSPGAWFSNRMKSLFSKMFSACFELNRSFTFCVI